MTTVETGIVYLECQLWAGAFSGEKLFRLRTAEASGELIAGAGVRHCYNGKFEQLKPSEPPTGKKIEGHIAARIVRELEGESVLVSVPSGDVVAVPASAIVRPKK